VDANHSEADQQMRRVVALLGAVALATLAGPRGARAQSAAEVLAQGVRAYQDLEFDGAAGLLRRSLAFQGSQALAPAGAARALIYLAATELFRKNPDSAAAVARRLVLLDPRFRPDELVFPPQVLALYDGVRRTTPTVIARAPADTSIRPGAGAFAVRLYASTFHDVSATLGTEAGRLVRTLYAGPIGDSLALTWNGLDSSGARPPDGRYTLTVTSLDRGRRAVRMLRLPIEVAQPSVDTLPRPAPPPDSLLRPERQPMGPAARAFAPAALTGLAIVALPSLVANREDASGTRFLVGGAVTIAGIAAFLSHHPGRPIPGNAAHNRALRDDWRRAVDDVTHRNAQRIREVRMRIRAGTPQLLTPEGP
jgi:flagellar hook capping protein FlgD